MLFRLFAMLLFVGGIGAGIYYLSDQRLQAPGGGVVEAERAPIPAPVTTAASSGAEDSAEIESVSVVEGLSEQADAPAMESGATDTAVAMAAPDAAETPADTGAALMTGAATDGAVEEVASAADAAAADIAAVADGAADTAANMAADTGALAAAGVEAADTQLAELSADAAPEADATVETAETDATDATAQAATGWSTIVETVTETAPAETAQLAGDTGAAVDQTGELLAAMEPPLVAPPVPAPPPVPATYTEIVPTGTSPAAAAVALDRLEYGAAFAEARAMLLENGWRPRSLRRSARPDEIAEIETALLGEGFDELVNCDSGERPLCRFEFVDGNERIAAVLTRGRGDGIIVVDSFRMTIATD